MAQTLAKTGRRLSAERRREQLLEVAAEIMLEQGFEALTMEAVKERAGVSRGLAYLHFANAEELAFALYEREVAELDRRIETVAQHHYDTFDDRVRAAMTAYLDFASDRGGLMALLQVKLVGRFTKPSSLTRLAKMFAFWAKALEQEFGTPPAEAAVLARAAIAAAEQFAAAWRAKKLPRRDAERMAINFALAGLRDAAVKLS